jgi:hypothetical protein
MVAELAPPALRYTFDIGAPPQYPTLTTHEEKLTSHTTRMATLMAAGVAAAGAVGVVGYHALGGRRAIDRAVSDEEMTAYSMVRKLDRVRKRLVTLHESEDSHDLASLREELEDMFEDIADVVGVDDDKQFDSGMPAVAPE